MDHITVPLELLLLLMTGFAWWLARRDLIKIVRDQQTPTLDKLENIRSSVEELLDELDEKIETLDERIKAATLIAQEPIKKPAPPKTPRVNAAKGTAVDDSKKSFSVVSDAPAAPDTRYNEVYALAEAGLSSEEIARRTGLGSAEVDMVISLRPI